MLSPVCSASSLASSFGGIVVWVMESHILNVRETRIRPPDIEINYADSWLPCSCKQVPVQRPSSTLLSNSGFGVGLSFDKKVMEE
jgi:hypothetical protein